MGSREPSTQRSDEFQHPLPLSQQARQRCMWEGLPLNSPHFIFAGTLQELTSLIFIYYNKYVFLKSVETKLSWNMDTYDRKKKKRLPGYRNPMLYSCTVCFENLSFQICVAHSALHVGASLAHLVRLSLQDTSQYPLLHLPMLLTLSLSGIR